VLLSRVPLGLLETVVGAGAIEEGGVEVGFWPDEFGEVANCLVVLLERVVSGAAIEEGELLVGFESDGFGELINRLLIIVIFQGLAAAIESSSGQRIIGGSGCWRWGGSRAGSKNWGRSSNRVVVSFSSGSKGFRGHSEPNCN